MKLSLDDARKYAANVLAANRVSAANAASVAHALVAAEADGLGGHGLSRLPSYAAQAKAGKIDGFAAPFMTLPRPGIVSVDAANGFAYPAIDLAIMELIDVTKREGLACAPIRRSHHCGAMGVHVERLAREGFCALMFANAPAAMPVWGGRKPLLGTNPIAFAAHVRGREAIVIDLSLSKVARGNVIAAKQRGEKIPEGWALDSEGNPTTDPTAALAGSMIPMGDAKGSALALMVEILAACLTGAILSKDASSFFEPTGGPPGAGQMILAFDTDVLSSNLYGARIADLVAAIDAEEGARLPGARRVANRRRAAQEGVTISESLQREIAALAS